jgi:hypothetical protein
VPTASPGLVRAFVRLISCLFDLRGSTPRFGLRCMCWMPRGTDVDDDHIALDESPPPPAPTPFWRRWWVPGLVVLVVLVVIVGVITRGTSNPSGGTQSNLTYHYQMQCPVAQPGQAVTCQITLSNDATASRALHWALSSASQVQLDVTSGSLAPGQSTIVNVMVPAGTCGFALTLTDTDAKTSQRINRNLCP